MKIMLSGLITSIITVAAYTFGSYENMRGHLYPVPGAYPYDYVRHPIADPILGVPRLGLPYLREPSPYESNLHRYFD